MSESEEPAGGTFTVAAEQAGQTLAAVVRDRIAGTSWSKARDLVRGGRVRIDGRAETDPARRLQGGERIELGLDGPAPRREELLVHLDADVAVVRKPAGLLTVPFAEDDRDTLLSRARVAVRRLDTARKAAHNPSLRAVQRLDKETSGLVVFARNVQAQRDLQRQFTAHTVLRLYLAIVHGVAEGGIHETTLVPDRGDGLRGSWGVFRPAWGTPPPEARQAITHVNVEERLRGATLVSCRLETGRTHQIRIHLAEAGNPLAGETVYIRDWSGPLLPAPRLMLHAAELGFLHPRTGKEILFREPLPDDFADFLTRLRRS